MSDSNAAITVTHHEHRITCPIAGCDFISHSLMEHIPTAHGMTLEEFEAQFPGVGTISAQLREELAKNAKECKRVAAPISANLTVDLMGFDFKVNTGVEESKCLPFPDQYAFPKLGEAKEVAKRVLIALSRRRNVFLWGMPGTGKDAIVHAFAYITRTPVLMLSFKPGTDLGPWFYMRSISSEGSSWVYGSIWEGITKGVLCRDGVRRAPLLLLSDVDRADEAQTEWFRILTDSISGRVQDPLGNMVPLIRDEEGNGVQFFCTANSCGTGDSRGRMASSRPIDASIFDRLGRKMEAAYMDWDDESAVLMAKFPSVHQRAPRLLAQFGQAVISLRAAITKQNLYAELTHRGLCDIMAEAEDLLHLSKDSVPQNLLSLAFRAWVDGLESDTKVNAKRLIDPHIKGGSV